MKLLKLIKLIKPESLARARKRVKRALRVQASKMIWYSIFRDGHDGYYRDIMYANK